MLFANTALSTLKPRCLAKSQPLPCISPMKRRQAHSQNFVPYPTIKQNTNAQTPTNPHLLRNPVLTFKPTAHLEQTCPSHAPDYNSAHHHTTYIPSTYEEPTPIRGHEPLPQDGTIHTDFPSAKSGRHSPLEVDDTGPVNGDSRCRCSLPPS